MSEEKSGKRMYVKAAAGFAFILIVPILLFVAGSGRWDWWESWLYIGILLGTSLFSRILLLATRPDVVRERAKWVDNQDVPAWDKRLMPIVAVYGPLVIYLVAALDKRWAATPALPVWLELAAFGVILLAFVWSIWALLANRFFSAVARIQADRGQTVVRAGPYRWVRHPGYAGGMIGYLVVPVALGTLWAYLPALLVMAAIVARTALEDRMLQADLPGYADYARETRWRLLPGVW